MNVTARMTILCPLLSDLVSTLLDANAAKRRRAQPSKEGTGSAKGAADAMETEEPENDEDRKYDDPWDEEEVSVPAAQWCRGQHSQREIDEARASRPGFFARLFGR